MTPMLKQRLAGIGILVVSYLSTRIEGDYTAAVMFAPLGAYLIVTKNKVFA